MRTVDPVKHEAKRRQILEVAAALFSRKGFERTTTADICARAGISSGALFHYFPNKRAVFAAIFEMDGRDVAAYLAEVAALHGPRTDPWVAVLGLVDIMVDGIDDPGYAGLALEATVHAHRDEDFAVMVSRNDRELREGLARLLEGAARKGQIDRNLDPAMAASWISALVGSLFLRAADPDFVPADELQMFRLILARFLRAPDARARQSQRTAPGALTKEAQ